MPRSFPGKVEIVSQGSKEQPGVHPQYRRYDNENIGENEDFYYFVTRILSSICPIQRDYSNRKVKFLISDIFTVTDEAFALMMLHNEYHVWVNQVEQERNGGDGNNSTAERKRKKKKYCDRYSGNKNGWSIEGLAVFNTLCREIAVLRKDPKRGKECEEKLRERLWRENCKNDMDSAGPSGGLGVQRLIQYVDEYISPELRALLGVEEKEVNPSAGNTGGDDGNIVMGII